MKSKYMLMVAAAAIATMSNNATAQEASPQPAVAYSELQDTTYMEFMGLYELIPGVALTGGEWYYFRENGCVVVGASPEVKEKMARVSQRHGSCGKEYYEELDDISKEGTSITLVRRTGNGVQQFESVKGIDVAANFIRVTTFALRLDANGNPMVFTSANFHRNGQTIVADTISGFIQSGGGGSLAQVAGNLTRPDCKNCGTYVNVEGVSNAAAGSNSESSSGIAANFAQTFSAADPCGSACANDNLAPPSHQAPSGNDVIVYPQSSGN